MMSDWDAEDLLASRDRLRVSNHALREAHKEGLRARDIFHALFHGKIVEQYPERRRVLIVGPARKFSMPVHVVCDYTDARELVAVTVYIPNRPDWLTAKIRSH